MSKLNKSKKELLACLDEWIKYIKKHLGIDSHSFKAYQQIYQIIQNQPEVDEEWLPTSENIDALPEPVRKYIHDIETNCDPASMVQENAQLKDTCKALEIKLEEKVQVHDELLIKYTEKFREDYERGFCSRNNYKGRLKQFSQEAGLEVVKK